MADTWELILHHAYEARPGIVFDESPGRGCHGSVVNIPDGAFEIDGATRGSGAVRFRPRSRIVVNPVRGWDRLGAVRVEVVCRLDTPDSGGILFDGFSFSLHVRHSTILVTLRNASTERFYPCDSVDVGDGWVTVGFGYDGFSTIFFALDGQVVGTTQVHPQEPILPTTIVNVGNEIRDDHAFVGLIDDVKVWRLNPYRDNDEFNDRPVDPAVQRCWTDWGRDFGSALDALADKDPECPPRIFALLERLSLSATIGASGSAPDGYDLLQRAARQYRDQWGSGDVDGVGDTLGHVLADLRDRGWDPTGDPVYQELMADPCWQQLISLLSPIDCDRRLVEMLTRLGGR